MRKTLAIGFVATLILVCGAPAIAGDGTWSGEILDMDCYNKNKAHGEKHAECAKKCLVGGATMGLLTEDGDVVYLVADSSNMKPFDELKELGGQTAEVSGTAAKEDGKVTVTVTAAKKAM